MSNIVDVKTLPTPEPAYQRTGPTTGVQNGECLSLGLDIARERLVYRFIESVRGQNRVGADLLQARLDEILKGESLINFHYLLDDPEHPFWGLCRAVGGGDTDAIGAYHAIRQVEQLLERIAPAWLEANKEEFERCLKELP